MCVDTAPPTSPQFSRETYIFQYIHRNTAYAQIYFVIPHKQKHIS